MKLLELRAIRGLLAWSFCHVRLRSKREDPAHLRRKPSSIRCLQLHDFGKLGGSNGVEANMSTVARFSGQDRGSVAKLSRQQFCGCTVEDVGSRIDRRIQSLVALGVLAVPLRLIDIPYTAHEREFEDSRHVHPRPDRRFAQRWAYKLVE